MQLLRDHMKALSAKDQLDSFADRCGTTVAQLRQISGGHRPCREALAIAIERESGGAVLCEDLRPDVDWAYLRSTKVKKSKAA